MAASRADQISAETGTTVEKATVGHSAAVLLGEDDSDDSDLEWSYSGLNYPHLALSNEGHEPRPLLGGLGRGRLLPTFYKTSDQESNYDIQSAVMGANVIKLTGQKLEQMNKLRTRDGEKELHVERKHQASPTVCYNADHLVHNNDDHSVSSEMSSSALTPSHNNIAIVADSSKMLCRDIAASVCDPCSAPVVWDTSKTDTNNILEIKVNEEESCKYSVLPVDCLVIHITHVVNPSNFYARLGSLDAGLEFERCVEDYAASSYPQESSAGESPMAGQHVICKANVDCVSYRLVDERNRRFKDCSSSNLPDEKKHWYRGLVVGRREEEADVLFIDYGVSQVVPRRRIITEVPEYVRIQPSLAVMCTLCDVHPAQGQDCCSNPAADWSAQATELFRKTVSVCDLRAVVKCTDDSSFVFPVTLYSIPTTHTMEQLSNAICGINAMESQNDASLYLTMASCSSINEQLVQKHPEIFTHYDRSFFRSDSIPQKYSAEANMLNSLNGQDDAVILDSAPSSSLGNATKSHLKCVGEVMREKGKINETTLKISDDQSTISSVTRTTFDTREASEKVANKIRSGSSAGTTKDGKKSSLKLFDSTIKESSIGATSDGKKVSLKISDKRSSGSISMGVPINGKKDARPQTKNLTHSSVPRTSFLADASVGTFMADLHPFASSAVETSKPMDIETEEYIRMLTGGDTVQSFGDNWNERMMKEGVGVRTTHSIQRRASRGWGYESRRNEIYEYNTPQDLELLELKCDNNKNGKQDGKISALRNSDKLKPEYGRKAFHQKVEDLITEKIGSSHKERIKLLSDLLDENRSDADNALKVCINIIVAYILPSNLVDSSKLLKFLEDLRFRAGFANILMNTLEGYEARLWESNDDGNQVGQSLQRSKQKLKSPEDAKKGRINSAESFGLFTGRLFMAVGHWGDELTSTLRSLLVDFVGNWLNIDSVEKFNSDLSIGLISSCAAFLRIISQNSTDFLYCYFAHSLDAAKELLLSDWLSREAKDVLLSLLLTIQLYKTIESNAESSMSQKPNNRVFRDVECQTDYPQSVSKKTHVITGHVGSSEDLSSKLFDDIPRSHSVGVLHTSAESQRISKRASVHIRNQHLTTELDRLCVKGECPSDAPQCISRGLSAHDSPMKLTNDLDKIHLEGENLRVESHKKGKGSPADASDQIGVLTSDLDRFCVGVDYPIDECHRTSRFSKHAKDQKLTNVLGRFHVEEDNCTAESHGARKRSLEKSKHQKQTIGPDRFYFEENYPNDRIMADISTDYSSSVTCNDSPFPAALNKTSSSLSFSELNRNDSTNSLTQSMPANETELSKISKIFVASKSPVTSQGIPAVSKVVSAEDQTVHIASRAIPVDLRSSYTSSHKIDISKEIETSIGFKGIRDVTSTLEKMDQPQADIGRVYNLTDVDVQGNNSHCQSSQDTDVLPKCDIQPITMINYDHWKECIDFIPEGQYSLLKKDDSDRDSVHKSSKSKKEKKKKSTVMSLGNFLTQPPKEIGPNQGFGMIEQSQGTSMGFTFRGGCSRCGASDHTYESCAIAKDSSNFFL